MITSSESRPTQYRHGELRRSGWYISGRVCRSEPVIRVGIDSESFTVGRRTNLNLTIPSPRVSGRHAELLLVAQHLFIRDLGSTNGTYVNRDRLVGTRKLNEGDHIEIADVEFRVGYEATVDSSPKLIETLKKTNEVIQPLERDWMFSQFDELLRGPALTPFMQPILRFDDLSVIGYEALARSTLDGLQNPGAMFEIAGLLGRELELSGLCRQRAMEIASPIAATRTIFFNTHPNESLEEQVLPQMATLRSRYPDARMMLEIHEGSIHDIGLMREFIARLKDLGVQIAYDDFGAGRARLLELIQCPPDFLKFDIGLIRGIDSAPEHQHRMVKMLVEIASDFNAKTLAEGVETAAEAETCRNLGFEFAQGYLYGRPAPFAEVSNNLLATKV
ncbi:MAG: EAL domain-containing protein [Planctomycetaceae bacterium]